MTDPVYGDNPIDPGALWDGAIAPIFATEPSTVVTRNVWSAGVQALIDDEWLIRWRTSATQAEGVQLDEHGNAINYPRPDGWTDDRYKPVVLALLPTVLGRITPPRVTDVAFALLDGIQTFTVVEPTHCTAVFTFLDTSLDDATAYASALNRARNKGTRYVITYHPGGGTGPFTLDVSTLDGPDTLAGQP
jgi:hypothetical protein